MAGPANYRSKVAAHASDGVTLYLHVAPLRYVFLTMTQIRSIPLIETFWILMFFFWRVPLSSSLALFQKLLSGLSPVTFSVCSFAVCLSKFIAKVSKSSEDYNLAPYYTTYTSDLYMLLALLFEIVVIMKLTNSSVSCCLRFWRWSWVGDSQFFLHRCSVIQVLDF